MQALFYFPGGGGAIGVIFIFILLALVIDAVWAKLLFATLAVAAMGVVACAFWGNWSVIGVHILLPLLFAMIVGPIAKSGRTPF